MEKNPQSEGVLKTLILEYETMATQEEASILTEDAYHKLITHYENELLFDKALEVTDKAIEFYRFSSEFLLRKADIYLTLKLGADALDLITQAEEQEGESASIQLVKAKTLAFLGNKEEAIQLLSPLKQSPNCEIQAEAFIVEAYVCQMEKDYEGMFECLYSALKNCPHKLSAIEPMWTASEVCRKFRECADLMISLIDEDPYNYQAWYYLGHCYSYLCEYEAAIDAYEYAFIINERFEAAYKDCADLCRELKKYTKAIKFYKEAINTFGPDAEYLFDIGQCYFNLKKYKDAKRYFLRSLKIDPYNDEAFFQFGLCLAQEKRWTSAINAILRAVDLDETREEYFAGLAEIYLKQGDKPKAEYYYKMAIECGPEQSTIWLSYARYLVEENRHKEAMRLLKEADEYAVGADLLYGMAACHYINGKTKKALDMMAEALIEDYNGYRIMFDFVPEIQKDPEVKSIIAYYGSEFNLF